MSLTLRNELLMETERGLNCVTALWSGCPFSICSQGETDGAFNFFGCPLSEGRILKKMHYNSIAAHNVNQAGEIPLASLGMTSRPDCQVNLTATRRPTLAPTERP
jgi:hypothetical protein